MARSGCFERISADDLTQLATDVGPAPMNVAAVLILDAVPERDLPRLTATLGARMCAMARLRQKLVELPWGQGRPIWVDDPRFDVGNHLEQSQCRPPGGTRELMDLAAQVVGQPLDRCRPLWRAVVVTGLAEGRVGLVLVFHHVVADGIGGLAVLAGLVDGPASTLVPSGPQVPRPGPSTGQLVTDALTGRIDSIRRIPAVTARLWAARSELGGPREPLAPRCSLNVPCGPRRRVDVVAADLAQVRAVAHAHGATVNDLMLVAITGALVGLLARRGEVVPALVVSVPVAARASTTAADLGNRTGVMPVRVPTSGPHHERLAQVSAHTRAHRAGTRGASMAVVGPAFRLLASLGIFRMMIERQRLVNTFLTNLPGPVALLTIDGVPIRQIVPVTITAGNVSVAFAVLSYAGTLTLSVITDPAVFGDCQVLVGALRAELADLLGR
ncbi:MAG: wax ester/triacylglycerol synthase domain-containing protein [Candidatus Nanopelagicales bacterium]